MFKYISANLLIGKVHSNWVEICIVDHLTPFLKECVILVFTSAAMFVSNFFWVFVIGYFIMDHTFRLHKSITII